MSKKTKNPFGLSSLDPITLQPDELERVATVLAHFAATLDSGIDEFDSYEFILEFLQDEGRPLDMVTVEDLAQYCRATRLGKMRDDGGKGPVYN